MGNGFSTASQCRFGDLKGIYARCAGVGAMVRRNGLL
jgi:hypothetical protein